MTHSIHVVYAAMFYYVIRCLTRLYVFFHSALSLSHGLGDPDSNPVSNPDRLGRPVYVHTGGKVVVVKNCIPELIIP